LPPQEIRCQNCAEHNFYFDRIITAYEYGFPLDRLLHQLKYHSKIEYTRLLSQLFWQQIAPQLHQQLPDVIIPVPLHQNKQKQRGFNQVNELLQEFCQLNRHIQIYQAFRTKETSSQATLNRQQRVQNVQDAFQIRINLVNKRVTIIDDVVTTGTTVSELARLCKRAGAIQVDVWCLMRANHD
jgi:ComF family protein